MLDIYSGHFFIYRSLFAADPRDPRVKVAVINAACDESCADVAAIYRTRVGAARRVPAPFGRGCLHGSPGTRVGTREYP